MTLNSTPVFCICALSFLSFGYPRPASVSITASSDTVRASPTGCETPYTDSEAGCSPTSPYIELTATAGGFKSRKLIYAYTVTGGKITGRGPHVRWDLSGLGPGVYSVRVEVEDRRGVRATASKQIPVERCTCPLIPPP